jgi:ABC-type nitrate/sulfonate/bicarbonate transport system permease component
MRLLRAAVISVLKQARGTLPFVAGLIIWQTLGSDTSPQLPRPSAWLTSLLALAGDGTLLPAIAATVSILLISLVVAAAVGFCVGLMIGTSARMRDWCSLLLEYLRAVPPPVLIPVFVLMLGYSNLMKIVVIGFAGLWPVLLNTITGVSAIPPLAFDVARSLRMSRFETMTKVVIPGAVPALMLGIRVALPHVIIITLVVEMFTGATGVGGLMMAGERNFDAAAVFALLVLVGILGLALTAVFNGAERLIIWRWSAPV